MKFLIVRHGETNENKEGIVQGSIQGTLSPLGKDQVRKLALRLKNEKIDEIHSSDLARALDTAQEIAKYHPGLQVNVNPLLRERCHGIFEGKKTNAISQEEFNKYFNTLEGKPPGGESWIEVGKRVECFLHQIVHKNSNKTVLLVTHGGVIIALLCILTGTLSKDAEKFHKQHNTCVNIIEIKEDKSHKLHLLNCTKHLEVN